MPELSRYRLHKIMKMHTSLNVPPNSVTELKVFLEDLIQDIVKSAEGIAVLNKRRSILPRDLSIAEILIMERKVDV